MTDMSFICLSDRGNSKRLIQLLIEYEILKGGKGIQAHLSSKFSIRDRTFLIRVTLHLLGKQSHFASIKIFIYNSLYKMQTVCVCVCVEGVGRAVQRHKLHLPFGITIII
uniref:Uncharacterized protein n=1 Tax=Arundo donax TaxID=35708 RepID=A0A0A9HKA1_ARUDO